MKGPPPAGAGVTVRVAFVVEDEPYWIDVPYIDDAGSGRSEGEDGGGVKESPSPAEAPSLFCRGAERHAEWRSRARLQPRHSIVMRPPISDLVADLGARPGVCRCSDRTGKDEGSPDRHHAHQALASSSRALASQVRGAEGSGEERTPRPDACEATGRARPSKRSTRWGTRAVRR